MVSPTSLIPMTFERPWLWLLLPLALGVILLAVRFSRVYLPPRRKTLSILLRVLLLTLIVGSLTEPQLQLPQRHLNVVFLLDASDSVGQSGIDAAAAWIRRALQHIGPHDKAGVVVFGQDALVEQSLAHLTNLPAIQSVPERGYTDIAQAIRLGLALVASSSGERRLILLSDGNENIGSATAEARI
ncbi:MAG: VWA domain-containing protein, partial [Chloroflexi bacterium]|nr:VWA domain-containing protein [Chloroflexota bacterium]